MALLGVRLDELRGELAGVGGLLVLHALDGGSDVVRRRLAGAFALDADAAWRVAKRALRAAADAQDRAQALGDRVRELERRLTRLEGAWETGG